MTNLFYLDINPTLTKAVVLIHGLGANANSWQYQTPVLENAGYRVIVPDMRGFGQTNYAKGHQNTIESMADDVYELMQKLGIKSAALVGLSMGGAIAMVFALKYPQMATKLVLANTAARFAGKTGGWLYTLKRIIIMRFLPRRFGAKMVSNFIFPKPSQQEFRQEFMKEILMADDRAYFDCVKTIIKHDIRDKIGAIAQPVLAIGGQFDLITPPFQQRFLVDNIKGAKLVIIQGAGHVSSVDSAAEFNKEMLAFLGDSC